MAIEFSQGEIVIRYKKKGLLSENPSTGIVPQLIKGLWRKAGLWFERDDRRGITSGLDEMWRDALRKHPQYFIAL